MSDREILEKYLIEEFYDDYREGEISRRTFIRRVAFITGSMSATITALAAVGCTPAELPAPTEPMPTPEPPTAAATLASATEATQQPTSAPTTEARSPLSVAEDDPAVSAGWVRVPSGDTEIDGYLASPAAEGRYPAVMVCHENRGLTPHIQDVTRRFAKAGYVALALDLLSREGGTAANDRDQVPGLLTDAGPERHVGDFLAAADYLRAQANVEGERLAMNGYCFGGGITWRVATAMPELKAAVPFYGPAPELSAVPNIGAAVLGVYAEEDERINAGIPELEAALQAAGTTYAINVYPGVNHAFHNDTSERYDETQATQAWNDMLEWLATHV